MAPKRRRTGAVSKVVYETQAAFRFALRQFLRFSETAARDVGLTPQQYQALLAIRGYPGRDRVRVDFPRRRAVVAARRRAGPHRARPGRGAPVAPH